MSKPMYMSTKTYDKEFSCAFRQWRADSHCNKLHGYALQITIVFGATELDERNWVVDFGGMAELKKMLKDHFDHTTIVAWDDPEYDLFLRMSKHGIINLRMAYNVGCEAFASKIYKLASNWLKREGYTPRCKVTSVEVREHGGNSAIYGEA